MSLAPIDGCRRHIQLKTVYISHPGRVAGRSEALDRRPHKTISMVMPKAKHDALRVQEYTAEHRGRDEDHPTPRGLTLSNDDDHTITIESYQHTLDNDGEQLKIEAQMKMSGQPWIPRRRPPTTWYGEHHQRDAPYIQ